MTSEVEADTSRTRLGGVEVATIPNAIEVPKEKPHRVWRPEGRLRLAFLSRVHPKKGLEMLIDALVDLPDYVSLSIYGAGEAGYLSALQDRISKAGLIQRIEFHGLVEGEEKSAALRNCDLFVLPTYSENFGNVVAEALAHGTPVVVTKGAPWGEIEKVGCGYWTDVSTDGLREAILTALDSESEEMGRRGRAWIIHDFSVQSTVAQFDDLYRALAAR